MSTYTIVKDMRKASPEAVTLDLIDAAISDQEQKVRETAVACARTVGLSIFATHKSPFPTEEADAHKQAAATANYNLQHEMERLSKLVSWRETKALGL